MQDGLGLSEEPKELANGLMLEGVPAHRLVGDDAVEDTATLAPGSDIPRLAQITKDQRNAALTHLESVGHVTHPQPGLVFDRE